MFYRLVAVGALLLMGGCTHWGQKIAAAECSKAGMPIGTAGHADCVSQWLQEDRERARAPFRDLLTLGGLIDTRSDEERAVVACEQAGWPPENPSHRECITNTVATWQAERSRKQAEFAQGLALGAAIFQQPAPIGPAGSLQTAPLVNRSVSGMQTICTYHAPTGNFQVMMSGTCPSQMTYGR